MKRTTLAAAVCAVALLAGCGGGGGGATDGATPTTPGEITENAGYQAPQLTDPPSATPAP